jgi:hypothetical protein
MLENTMAQSPRQKIKNPITTLAAGPVAGVTESDNRPPSLLHRRLILRG